MANEWPQGAADRNEWDETDDEYTNWLRARRGQVPLPDGDETPAGSGRTSSWDTQDDSWPVEWARHGRTRARVEIGGLVFWSDGDFGNVELLPALHTSN